VKLRALGIDDEHECSTFEWNFAFWQNRARWADEFGPHHTDSIVVWIISLVQKVPANMLTWRGGPPTFRRSEKAVANLKCWLLPGTFAVGLHEL
jgi:hypothetical protein